MSDAADLLPPNATELEQALVRSAARAIDTPVPIRELWDVDNCPERILPYLAWSLAVPTWSSAWPVEVKRSRIRSAINVHRRKGTIGSIRAVVSAFGSSLAVREWWQREPMGVPHTFEITLTVGAGAPQDAEFQTDILDAVDRVKPVRSSYQLVAGLQASATLRLIAATNPIVYQRVELSGRATLPRDLRATFSSGAAWAMSDGSRMEFSTIKG